MPNLLQATNFEKKTVRLLKEENILTERFDNLVNLYDNSVSLVGETEELKNKINEELNKKYMEIRLKYWKNNKKLPKGFEGVRHVKGYNFDEYTALSMLPQVKISEFRNLADKFNMLILPLEYTEIDKLFDTQENSYALKNAFSYYKSVLEKDTTCKYQIYLLCPIDYYSVWEQIKSEVVKDIYYPDYFESVFTTIELMIPAQKNLYLASKTNNENIQELNKYFSKNIETLSSKIVSLSEKVNKLEVEFLEQQRNIRRLEQQNTQLSNELENAKLKFQEEINFLYRNIDPVMFAVPQETDIKKDDVCGIVGLCWGKDIDEMVFELKGITINHKKLDKINPISLKNNMNLLSCKAPNFVRELSNNRYFSEYSEGRYLYKISLDGNFELHLNFKTKLYDFRDNTLTNITLMSGDTKVVTIKTNFKYYRDSQFIDALKNNSQIIETLNNKAKDFINTNVKKIMG